MRFVEVILPLKLAWSPTYRAPEDAVVGSRVRVIFARKEYIGVVNAVDVVPEIDESRVQDIIAIEDGLQSITEGELRFWGFLSDYYLCSKGEIYKAAYPVTKVRSEQNAAAAVKRADESRQRTHDAAVQMTCKRLEKLRYRLSRKEDLIAGKKEGTKTRAALEEERSRILEDIAAAQKALSALMEEAVLPETAEPSPVRSRTPRTPGKPAVIIGPERNQAYLDAIRKAQDSDCQVLVLTPEKSSCKAMSEYLLENLDEPHSIFSSDLSAAARRRTADDTRCGRARVIIGTRAALWLPFANLGLVIIDQEQDILYKQTEPAPRYHARDAAIALAAIHGADVLLGSCYPSFETMANLISGKYRSLDGCKPTGASAIVEGALPRTSESIAGLPYGETGSDAITIVDIPGERRKNGMKGPVSRVLMRRASELACPLILLRGWEKAEELEELVPELFPHSPSVRIMNMAELKREGPGNAGLIAVLQADALVSRDDFRADERARQLVAELHAMAPEVIIQTSVPDRFGWKRSAEELLAERKMFGLPPYTRLVDINIYDDNKARMSLMVSRLGKAVGSTPMVAETGAKLRIVFARDARLAARKAELAATVQKFEQEQKYPGHIVLDADPL